ncbi:hypothetical protein COT44_05015 [Candidatus Shapirobacteria bacterium CG08_land_8_20_14_0_20_39_18]|uniref:Uncharacterized protein n=1 Tax=Candidatus Shapirobacteria bacterium CG08_land_8_20_14_0_20_39_18 TaxID=1974883 RepID=A0A2M6XBV4_9BACT|nr:MAG: hypothetical protein COT44_05015 [Candidatus Shapirobacteria bacterium CG08_land_8_20_14_0_20_39_18]PIY64897.1 MAG: hypothetical protein COY91_04060 [Candidatus Shapirobacteria bacterium CG_4_10_14_0_8_um_filter_39_15]PJE68451.1 MAG: hypothetical protein COU94_01780 [Candidatus Shapirobacteria bacterium CG10_big_fil_rev_8_21_14_0_10_38_8]
MKKKLPQRVILSAATGSSGNASLDSSTSLGMTIETATISGSLLVSGKTTVNDLGVTGKISAGLLTIDGLTGCHPEASAEGSSQKDSSPSVQNDCGTGVSINTLSGPLKLQSLALGNIEMMGGLVTIDTKGNITTQGTVTAKEIQAETIKVFGDKTAGSAILPAGLTSITIDSENATDSARIYLTPNTLSSKILTVTAKKIGSFVVGIKSPETIDLKFDWLIIQ